MMQRAASSSTNLNQAQLPAQPSRSVLLITLDSCRYDTFCEAHVPHMRKIGNPHRALAPATFTLPSHAAIFRGFTPSDPHSSYPIVNPRVGKLFRLRYGSFPDDDRRRDQFTLLGSDIVEGFGQLGYTTLGTGAMAWFDERLPTGRTLSENFDSFFYTGAPWGIDTQVAWLTDQLVGFDGQPTFVFLNVGETHIPYWHEGAPWSPDDNPCNPYTPEANDADECRRRQRTCLEYVDSALAPLLQAFSKSSVLICGDHGDAWGEDELWSHGFCHDKVMEVPLLFRTADLRPDERCDHSKLQPSTGPHESVKHHDRSPDIYHVGGVPRPSKTASEAAPGDETRRYIELLKRCLVDWLAPIPMLSVPQPDGSVKVTSGSDADRDKRRVGLDWPASGMTMIGLERLSNLQHCIEAVVTDGVPGDFIEAGVWRGGATMFTRTLLDTMNSGDRLVWAADSFRGLPSPDATSYPADKNDAHHTVDYLAVSLDEVKRNFELYDIATDGVRFLQGWFRDTLPTLTGHQWALIRLDGDMYESTIIGLEMLYPYLAPGGFLIVDDYGAVAGCREAVDDFRERFAVKEPIQWVDWTGIYWRKPIGD